MIRRTSPVLTIIFLTQLGSVKPAVATSAPAVTAAKESHAITTLNPITIPRQLSYQGRLNDSLNNPVPDGDYQLTFRLYTQETGGTPFWSEVQTVTIRNGIFSVILGSVTPITGIPETGDLYLSLQVESSGELTPRLKIVSSAYSFLSERAANADRFQNRDTSYFARATHTHPYVDSAGGAARIGGLNLNGLDTRYVNENQANSVTSTMVTDGTILRADVSSDFKAPYADTADYARIAPATDSARVAANTHRFQNRDTSYFARATHTHPYVDSAGGAARIGGLNLNGLDTRYVNENQLNSITSEMITDGQIQTADIADNAVNSAKIQDGAITGADLNSMGATTGQVLKWTGSSWAPRNDSIGPGDNAWTRTTPDSVLFTIRQLGIARGGASNMLYGIYRYNHINLGVACTTGTSESDRLYCTVTGGLRNNARGSYSTISGGSLNNADGNASTVGGGFSNATTGYAATVSGGSSNIGTGNYSTVGGGIYCTAGGNYSSVGGGYNNSATGIQSVVAGGHFNSASAEGSAVGGGSSNTASGVYSTVGGGGYNTAADLYTTICGGRGNRAEGYYAAVGGGVNDSSLAFASFTTNGNSVVPSGYNNSAAFNGQTATAAGQLRCGTLSKAGGSFTIDHPLDPYGKILNHYFVEGPEMLNIYRGVVTLDASGRAEVNLPDYFSALNRNPHIQLTGVGSPEVYVAEKIKGNRFVIGGKPGMEVYWQVTGERADVSAEAIRRLMPVEQVKTGALAGRMLDDEFLSGCMEQLEREGKAEGINFRTPAGRARYERLKQRASGR